MMANEMGAEMVSGLADNSTLPFAFCLLPFAF